MAKSRTLLLAVKSPLQALNAIEYCRRPQTRGAPAPQVRTIVFCPPRKPRLSESLVNLLARLECAETHVVPTVPGDRQWWEPRTERRLVQRFGHALSDVLASIPTPDEIVLGDYRSRECRHLASLFPRSEVVLLDDGSATHQIARFRRNPRDPKLAPMFPSNDFRALRLKLWAGVALPFIDRLTFFSHYALTPPSHDRLIRHRYEFWRSLVAARQRPRTDEVLFLGMSHVEKNLTTRDRYLGTLKKIRLFYNTRRVVYRPHRDEAADKLTAVQALGFIIAAPDITPVELLLIEATSLPAEVASIASSALDNLAILFGDTLALRCFTPDPDYCNAPMSGHFSDIVAYHVGNPIHPLAVSALADQPAY